MKARSGNYYNTIHVSITHADLTCGMTEMCMCVVVVAVVIFMSFSFITLGTVDP